jgi:GTPase SAR1 family protein
MFEKSDTMKMKICLVGEGAVGKTSLIRRYVLDEFDDRYISTLGAKITKKELVIGVPTDGNSLKVDMTIWDIMGEKGFRDLLKEAYFHLPTSPAGTRFQT